MSNVIIPNANLREINVGTLLDIPSNALPPALLDPPAPAVVIELNGSRHGMAYIAAVALEYTPFLTLRWDADARRFADVAAWPDLHDARLAAESLRVLVDQRARGVIEQPHVYCRVVGANRSRWRVVGPSWGGAVEEIGSKGRARVYSDHDPDPIGYSASLRAGARKLARLEGMPHARLV